MGQTLFFSALEPTHGFELWKTDGTDAGTTVVADLAPGGGSSVPKGLSVVGGTLYFSAAPDLAGWQLFRSDGTPDGTRAVKDFIPPATTPATGSRLLTILSALSLLLGSIGFCEGRGALPIL